MHEAVSEAGEIPPATNHISRDVKTVTVQQWRTYANMMAGKRIEANHGSIMP